MAKAASKKSASSNGRPVMTVDAAPTGGAAPEPAPAPAPPATPGTGPPELVQQAGELGAASVRALRSVLPERRLPLVLLGAALLVAGVVEVPVVVGVGLAYEALRRW